MGIYIPPPDVDQNSLSQRRAQMETKHFSRYHICRFIRLFDDQKLGKSLLLGSMVENRGEDVGYIYKLMPARSSIVILKNKENYFSSRKTPLVCFTAASGVLKHCQGAMLEIGPQLQFPSRTMFFFP